MPDDLKLHQEIHAAIELLAKHGYRVWYGGGRIVSEYERKKLEMELKAADEFRALRHGEVDDR